MSITVELKELKDYEAICRDWWNRRTLALEKSLTSASSCGGFEWVRKVNLEAMKAWDAENPFPKLIPSV